MFGLSKIQMHEFWVDYIKKKHNKKVRSCCIDTNSFIIHIKTEYVYEDGKDEVEERFDMPNYEVGRPCLITNNKNVLSMIKILKISFQFPVSVVQSYFLCSI